MRNKLGALYLFPVDLGDAMNPDWAGPGFVAALKPLRHFVVEHPKSARRFLKQLGMPLTELDLETLDEHSGGDEAIRLARPLTDGVDIGVLSEAGCPAVADPGAALVAEAHRIGARVVPMVGPSSIVLALMASGMNGQRFAFHGYLPQRSPDREHRIADIESRSAQADETEIFIEAPYRNNQLFKALLSTCHPETLICAATDLTLATESIQTRTVRAWASSPPQLDKRPTVFLLQSRRPPSRSTERARRPRRPE
jgi:16S rRNA (cytidine1402-2'-O)-methyltransferase